DYEIAIPIIGPFPTRGCVSIRELSGSPSMACLIHTGGYSSLDRASIALHTWITRNGYKVNGPLRTVFLGFGVGNVDYVLPTAFLTRESSAYVTELQIPVTSTW